MGGRDRERGESIITREALKIFNDSYNVELLQVKLLHIID